MKRQLSEIRLSLCISIFLLLILSPFFFQYNASAQIPSSSDTLLIENSGADKPLDDEQDTISLFAPFFSLGTPLVAVMSAEKLFQLPTQTRAYGQSGSILRC
jgi:hypothetical protein